MGPVELSAGCLYGPNTARAIENFPVVNISQSGNTQDWIWSDEFNGPNIDTSKWSHEVNGDGGGNNELQYYTARTNNSFIEDGKLVMHMIRCPIKRHRNLESTQTT